MENSRVARRTFYSCINRAGAHPSLDEEARSRTRLWKRPRAVLQRSIRDYLQQCLRCTAEWSRPPRRSMSHRGLLPRESALHPSPSRTRQLAVVSGLPISVPAASLDVIASGYREVRRRDTDVRISRGGIRVARSSRCNDDARRDQSPSARHRHVIFSQFLFQHPDF